MLRQEYIKKYKEENKETILAYQKAYRDNHREKLKEGQKSYYQRNKEKIKEKSLQRYRNLTEEQKKEMFKRSYERRLKRFEKYPEKKKEAYEATKRWRKRKCLEDPEYYAKRQRMYRKRQKINNANLKIPLAKKEPLLHPL